MEKDSLVTISIPTYNSAKFIGRCLDAVRAQTYKNIEINIVDGNSQDETISIAKKYTDKIIEYPGALLEARFKGLLASNGEYILLLDSDQILEVDAVERAVAKMQDNSLDMLVLEEDVYRKENFIEKLFYYDRVLIHSVKDFDPMTSVMLPRFYRVSQLRQAMENIPAEVREKVGGQDHAIIYYEMSKLTGKVDLLEKVVKHIEPDSLRTMWKKFYRWGATIADAKFGPYEDFLKKKERFRRGLWSKGLFVASFASILLLLIKGIPYKLGQSRRK
jgi:glycosyltransferase involved in cell wall biosynthesis